MGKKNGIIELRINVKLDAEESEEESTKILMFSD
jgi:hypothetical protein